MADYTRSTTLPALTGLRFIAALCVVVAHGAGAMTNMPAGAPAWHTYMVSVSAIGMTLFFVLSGFVIHYNYSEQISRQGWRGIANFFSARFARLYPLFLVSATVVVYCQGLFTAAWRGDAAAAANITSVLPFFLTLTHSWIYAVKGEFSLIYQYPSLQVMGVSWSISTEMFFYLVYPLICILLMRLKRSQLWLATALIVVAGLGGMAVLFHAKQAIDGFGEAQFGPIAGIAHGFQDSFFRWLVYFSPYVRIPEFLMGCLAAAFYRAREHRTPSSRELRVGRTLPYLAVAMVLVLDFVMFSPSQPSPFITFLHLNFGFAVPVALLIFSIARYETVLGRIMSAKCMLVCGEASYSIYLLHGLIMPNAGLAILPVGESAVLSSINLIRLVVAVLVTIGFSMVTYRIVEHPARVFLRKVLTIRLEAPAGQLAPVRKAA